MTTITTSTVMQYGPGNNERKIVLEISITGSQTWDELHQSIVHNVMDAISGLIEENKRAVAVAVGINNNHDIQEEAQIV